MIKKIDHIVITAKDFSKTIEFYEKLGFKVEDAGGRYELYAGDFKINVHILGRELLPKAKIVQPGSADICFEITQNIEVFVKEIKEQGIDIELDISSKSGVKGSMKSVYLRDPDGNLLEFSSYQ